MYKLCMYVKWKHMMYTAIRYEYIFTYLHMLTSCIYIYIPTHVNELCERITEIGAALILQVYAKETKIVTQEKNGRIFPANCGSGAEK